MFARNKRARVGEEREVRFDVMCCDRDCTTESHGDEEAWSAFGESGTRKCRIHSLGVHGIGARDSPHAPKEGTHMS